ncbi:AAA family ATPase [Salarchaeum sp. JOR-1]|uniref:AAA family ATPase n=1 Tax=Salarchaeum sp. JOR-1 TaxID=2599399 RepID=UPI0011987900|nr:AAA family ATPase [Salarchaeum sp. JOR-1]QDX41624.1 ATP-binding protein [Salarchaeum sp. JOR-1]
MSLLVVFGPPAAGKTTLATRLAERFDAPVLHSDDYTTRTYERLLDDAEARRREHPLVVLDGTFHDPDWRGWARDLDDAYCLYVTAALDTCLRRDWERADSIGEPGVRTIHRAFREQEATADADFTVDTRILPEETAFSLASRRVADWLSS